jgi:hypothetical protein
MHDQQLLKRWWIYGIVSPWPLAFQILSFAIERVWVDEIEKEELGEVKG